MEYPIGRGQVRGAARFKRWTGARFAFIMI